MLLVEHLYLLYLLRYVKNIFFITRTELNPESKLFRQRMSHTRFVGAQGNLAALGVWPIKTYSLNFVNCDGPGSAIPCGDVHQSFADTLVNWFFDNLTMFADSFSVLSIHYV